MAPPICPLYLTCLFMVNMAHTTTVKQSLNVESANVGVTKALTCSCQDVDAVMFYWYKQKLGEKPQLVSTFYRHNDNATFHDDFKNNPRLSLDTENYKYTLIISNVQLSDSATYHCVGSNLYDFEFCEGTTLSVKGSDETIPTLVHQSGSETIQQEDIRTLNCTVQAGACDGEHRVYWFKDSEESHPGLIYTHGGSKDQCKKKINTQRHSCVYNLPIDFSDYGTYYCAVASCGHILFGNRTKMEYMGKTDPPITVYILSGALAFTTILCVLLAFLWYKMNKRHGQHAEPESTATSLGAVNAAICQDTENIHYAALRDHRANASRRQRDATENVCVYSSVKR